MAKFSKLNKCHIYIILLPTKIAFKITHYTNEIVKTSDEKVSKFMLCIASLSCESKRCITLDKYPTIHTLR